MRKSIVRSLKDQERKIGISIITKIYKNCIVYSKGASKAAIGRVRM